MSRSTRDLCIDQCVCVCDAISKSVLSDPSILNTQSLYTVTQLLSNRINGILDFGKIMVFRGEFQRVGSSIIEKEINDLQPRLIFFLLFTP